MGFDRAHLHLDPERLERLRADGQTFDKNHKGFLSSAINAVRDRRDPMAALYVLSAMRNTAHARRPNQQQALDAVGRWVERRLTEAPGVHWRAFLTELGWLDRFAFIASERPGATAGNAGPEGRAQASFVFKFGEAENIEALRRKRASADSKPEVAVAPPSAQATLPRELPVRCDFTRLKETAQNALKRVKKKKDPKEVELALIVEHEVWGDRVRNLVLSTTGTEGFIDLARSLGEGLPVIFAILPEGFEPDGQEPVVVPRIRFEPRK